MTERPKIAIGYKVGHLTVREKTEKRKGGYTVWRCDCDCGGEICLDTRCLQRGKVTDCGCVSVVKPGMLDLTGERFGRLICLMPAEEKNASGGTQWVCRCDCGEFCVASVHQLRSGYKKSCGCLSHPPLKDYIGRRFGMLTVEAYAGKENGMHRWQCRCDCGNETVVGQTLLQSGKTKSCGCIRQMKQLENPIHTGENGRMLVEGTAVSTLVARMNKPPIATNTSGYNGVYRNRSGQWSAQITFKGKTYFLGSYSSLQEAAEARKQGEAMYADFLEWYTHRFPHSGIAGLCTE